MVISLDQKFKEIYDKNINMERLPATSNVDHDAIKTSATKIKEKINIPLIICSVAT